MSGEPRLLEVRKNVLKHNDFVAHALRERFRAQGTYVVSLVSSPGSGKTAFLERVLTCMGARHKVAALVGDLATDNDAVRLARSQAPVKQICTGTICHLDAGMVERSRRPAAKKYRTSSTGLCNQPGCRPTIQILDNIGPSPLDCRPAIRQPQ